MLRTTSNSCAETTVWYHRVTCQIMGLLSHQVGLQTSFMSLPRSSKFAGTGAHHHNRTAECAIQTIMSLANTMMLHTAIHWLEQADPSLWPMAVAHAVYLYNHVPQTGLGICLADLFTCTQWEQCKFHDCHMWGCPVYVLDKHLLDGKKIPHWKSYSKHLIYMGNSPMHASMVPLILNPDTGALLSAFHVVFDDWFTTIPLPENHEFSPNLWKNCLANHAIHMYLMMMMRKTTQSSLAKLSMSTIWLPRTELGLYKRILHLLPLFPCFCLWRLCLQTPIHLCLLTVWVQYLHLCLMTVTWMCLILFCRVPVT